MVLGGFSFVLNRKMEVLCFLLVEKFAAGKNRSFHHPLAAREMQNVVCVHWLALRPIP
jgi:hypothetical protein